MNTRCMALICRYLAIVIAGHGAMLALFAIGIAPRIGDNVAEPLASIGFYFFVVPAMLLAKPLNPLLWNLHLIEAPGWFTWPKPLGFLLVYTIWCVGLLALSLLLARFGKKV